MLSQTDRLQALVDRLRSAIDGQAILPIEAPKDDALGELEREINRLGEKIGSITRNRQLFSSGPVVLFRWIAEGDWPVESVSPNVLELTGYSAEEFISGRPTWASLVHPDDLPELVAATEAYTASNLTWYAHKPYRVIRRDSREIWVANYEMAHRDTAGKLTHYSGYIIDVSEQVEQMARLRDQEAQIVQLSSPILKVARGVLTMPVLGFVTSERAAQMTHDLLTAVSREQAKAAILDLTGLGDVDTATLDHLLRMSKSVTLLGCQCVLSGLSPEIAGLAVRLGFDIGSLRAVATLQDAIEVVTATPA